MRWWRCPANFADSKEIWRLGRELGLDADRTLALATRFYCAVSGLFETGEIELEEWPMLAEKIAPGIDPGKLLEALVSSSVVSRTGSQVIVRLAGDDEEWRVRHRAVFSARERRRLNWRRAKERGFLPEESSLRSRYGGVGRRGGRPGGPGTVRALFANTGRTLRGQGRGPLVRGHRQARRGGVRRRASSAPGDGGRPACGP